MQDFMLFEIVEGPGHTRPVRFTMRHKKREKVSVWFETALDVKSEHLPALMTELFKEYERKYRRATRTVLTARQRQIYDAIIACYRILNRAPTYQEIADAIGASSRGTAKAAVQRLVARGWVWVDKHGHAIPMDIAPPEIDDE